MPIDVAHAARFGGTFFAPAKRFGAPFKRERTCWLAYIPLL
jgi:hypothetical protein